MDLVNDLFSNQWLICAFIAWLIAQLIKGTLEWVKNKKFDLSRYLGAGGMPSSHSALVASMATIVGLTRGLNTVEFALALMVAFVVIYDSCGVRYESGQQAKLINQIIAEIKADNREDSDRKLKEFLGHTKLQTFAGTVLGILVSTIYYVIFVI